MKPREKAYHILKQVVCQQAHASLLIRQTIDDFPERDRAFITNLVYGTLKHYRWVRYQWTQFVKDSLSSEIEVLLDMAIYQLHFLDKTPSYAIVDETIELSKTIEYGKYKNLVTAVLHRYLKQGNRPVAMENELKQCYQQQATTVSKEVLSSLALVTSHPDWLVQLWYHHYGFMTTYQLCHFNNTVGAVELRVNTLKTTKEAVLQEPGFFNLLLAQQAVGYQGNIFSHPFYQNHQVVIQGQSSQRVSEIANPKPKAKVLDLCSAPGSKAFHMATLMQDQGEIVALDIHPHRVELIKQQQQRLKIQCVQAICMDATEVSQHYQAAFDIVLADVPCSGFGVLRGKPEIKQRIQPEDLHSLVALQARLLAEAAKVVKVSGQLIYSTCTLNRKENEKQVAAFLRENPNFECVHQETILPYQHQTDGFYIAKLTRVG